MSKVDLSQIPVYDKGDESKEQIKSCVAENILFKSLDADTLDKVVMAMEEAKVTSGETVIAQGANGDYYYVISSGTFECFKMPGPTSGEGMPESPGKLVYEYKGSGSFGELALMYDAPRAATVIATSDGVLWRLDRLTFRTLILSSAMLQKDKLPGSN